MVFLDLKKNLATATERKMTRFRQGSVEGQHQGVTTPWVRADAEQEEKSLEGKSPEKERIETLNLRRGVWLH